MPDEREGFTPDPGAELDLGLPPQPGPGPAVAPQGLREQIDYALSESVDRCARCKICGNQVDAVMGVLADAGLAVVSRDDLVTILAVLDAFVETEPALGAFKRLSAAAGVG